MLECVVNISEGRDPDAIAAIAAACGAALLDVHTDADHHRSVLTLAGRDLQDAARAARGLTDAVAERLDLSTHRGVHPRLGAIDVVPFVALAPTAASTAVEAARAYAEWVVESHGVPVFLYGDADPLARSLPEARRDAFRTRAPDLGSTDPHPRLGAVAVGARPPLVAINVELATDDLALARRVAAAVRERDGGLPGVRALGLALPGRGHAQVSMNLVALERTGIEEACSEVERRLGAEGVAVDRIELVGLVPDAARSRCSEGFLARSGIGPERSVEGRLAG
ncbi:MAG: glutamate formiminotransferase [Actinomycetes bacterium]